MGNSGMRKEKQKKTITQKLNEIVEQICNHYCKYPYEWDPEEHDGQELFDSEICQTCPLNRLG